MNWLGDCAGDLRQSGEVVDMLGGFDYEDYRGRRYGG